MSAASGSVEQNKHILRPKIVLDTNNTAIVGLKIKNFCGVKNYGCTAQEAMPNMCVNIVQQSMDNCIILQNRGPTAVIENVQQENNCCNKEDCSKHTKEDDCLLVSLERCKEIM